MIPFDRAAPGASGLGFGRFLGELRRPRFDLAIDLQGLLRSGVMTAATGAPVRVGLADAREGAALVLHPPGRPPGALDEAHAVDRLLAVAAAFGADVSRPRPARGRRRRPTAPGRERPWPGSPGRGSG